MKRNGNKKRFLNMVLWLLLAIILTTGIVQIYEKNLGRDVEAVDFDAEIPPARLIAVGEATHGNRETTLIRKELLMQLVEEHGCRAFLLETTFGDAEKINQYLLDGQGTAEQCVSNLDISIYRTEEMVELFQWIHDYNLLAEDHEKIRFYGIDIQTDQDSREALLSYIERADPERHQDYSALLGQLKPHEKAGAEPTFTDVSAEMERNKSQYVERTSEREYALAKMHADCIQKTTDYLLAEGQEQYNLRDGYMAENVLWILKHEETYYQNLCALLGAHNGHILRQSNLPLAYDKPMGQYLGEALGEDYYPIGLETGENTFWAWKWRVPWTYRIVREGWLVDLLTDASGRPTFVDLSDGNDPNAAAIMGRDWNITGIGYTYRRIRGLYPESSGLPVRLDAAYSAILFLPTATPAALLGGNNITMVMLGIAFGVTAAVLWRRRKGGGKEEG